MAKKQVKNIVSATITAADKTAVQTAIQTISSKLPFLIALTNEERMGGIKLGNKTLSFEEKAIEYATDNSSLVPNYVDLAELKRDYALAKDLTDILQWIKPLVQKIEDTVLETGVEALWPTLAFYQSVKIAAGRDVPGAKAIYNDLRQRFPGRTKKQTATILEAAAN